jgi:ATP dependent DNA ligase domain
MIVGVAVQGTYQAVLAGGARTRRRRERPDGQRPGQQRAGLAKSSVNQARHSVPACRRYPAAVTPTALTKAFPDVAAAISAHVPPSTNINGELVVMSAGSIDFTALLRRPASRRVLDAQLAHLVAFDLLATPDRQDLRALPYRERRARLEELLAGTTGALRLVPRL